MRHQHHRRTRGGAHGEPRQGGQQARVEAVLRLVEHEERRRAGTQQRGRPDEVAQRPVGNLGRRQRTQQARLPQQQVEDAVLVGDLHGRARERLVDRGGEPVTVTDLVDRRDRRGQVPPVGRQSRRPGADGSGPCGGARVGADLVVEPPGPQHLADGENLRSGRGVSELGEHAVEGRQSRGHDVPRTVRPAAADHGAPALAEQGGRPQAWAAPDRLALDLGVLVEDRIGRGSGGRGRARSSTRRCRALSAMPQVLGAPCPARAVRHGASGPRLFGTGPERRLQAALAGQRRDHLGPSRGREQREHPVQAGLAAAVAAGHDRQLADGHVHGPQRPVPLDRDAPNHGVSSRPSPTSCRHRGLTGLAVVPSAASILCPSVAGADDHRGRYGQLRTLEGRCPWNCAWSQESAATR